MWPDCQVILAERMEILKEGVLEQELRRLERASFEERGMTVVEWRIAQLSEPSRATRRAATTCQFDELLPPVSIR